MENQPLAEKMRPSALKDVYGQNHLIEQGKIIHEIISNKQPTSLILWGPPGSGKTTLARIIANEVNAEFIELSAVTSGKADVLSVIEHAKQNQRLKLRPYYLLMKYIGLIKLNKTLFYPTLKMAQLF